MRLKNKPYMKWVHLGLIVIWVLLVIPTFLWWSESILWVSFMSLYAIVGTHWSAYQGCKAEEASNG